MFNLNHLHLAHLQTVPFENLDISLGHRIKLKLPQILDKMVNHRRGGFCYELNSGFGWLLSEIGFDIKYLSARTFDGKALSTDFDHMLLLVDDDQPIIADVGFGDSFLLPLTAGASGCFQFDRQYRLLNDKKSWILQQKFEAEDWKSQYIFDMNPHPLHHFDAMCDFHQTSQTSIFTRKTVCSRATETGRITYANGRYIKNDVGQRVEYRVENEMNLNQILHDQFGINLCVSDLGRLMSAGHKPELESI